MIKKYINGHKVFIVLYLGICVLFAVTFILYRLPIAAVLYPVIVGIVFSIIVFCVGIYKEKSKIEVLKDAGQRGIYLDTESLPDDTAVEEEYKKTVEILLDERIKNLTEADGKYQDMSNYYTLWAHQIKTPIASMKLKLAGEDSRFSREMKTELLRIEQYVDMVMTYVRLGSGSTDYEFKECSLDTVIKSSVKKFSSDFIGKKLSLEFEAKGITTLTDEKWLGFVLEQLISNAIKYTQKGSIGIKTEMINERVCLTVSDTGIGIASENLPRIFEMGFTGVNGRMEDNRASGIGLFLVKKICKNLGIDISVESVLGKGSSVKLVFGENKVSTLMN